MLVEEFADGDVRAEVTLETRGLQIRIERIRAQLVRVRRGRKCSARARRHMRRAK